MHSQHFLQGCRSHCTENPPVYVVQTSSVLCIISLRQRGCCPAVSRNDLELCLRHVPCARYMVEPFQCAPRRIQVLWLFVSLLKESLSMLRCIYQEHSSIGPKKSDFDSTAGNAESQSGRKTGPIGAVVYESHAGSKSFEIRTAGNVCAVPQVSE